MIINIDFDTKEILGIMDDIPQFIHDDFLKCYIDIGNAEINLMKGKYFYFDGDVRFFEKPKHGLQPVFDYDQLKWIETATPEEIEEHYRRDEISFYNTELTFASKAVAELACGIITEEMFEDVKLYMQSIDPYSQNYKRAVKNKRPSIFDRYN